LSAFKESIEPRQDLAKKMHSFNPMGRKAPGKPPARIETVATGGKMDSTDTRIPQNFEDSVTEEMIGERRLWTAVLISAVQDWRLGGLRARREAQDFLFESDKDFGVVCARAGLDPGSLRVKLLKIGKRIGPQVRFANPLAA
jgi:hypothetical protein